MQVEKSFEDILAELKDVGSFVSSIIKNFEQCKPTDSIKEMLFNELLSIFRKRKLLIKQSEDLDEKFVDNYYNADLIKGRMESIEALEKMLFYSLASYYLKCKNPYYKNSNDIIRHHCKKYKDFYEKCFAYYCGSENILDPYTFLEDTNLFNKLYNEFSLYTEGVIQKKFNFKMAKTHTQIIFTSGNFKFDKPFTSSGRYTKFSLYRGRIDKSLGFYYNSNYLVECDTMRIIRKSFSQIVF